MLALTTRAQGTLEQKLQDISDFLVTAVVPRTVLDKDRERFLKLAMKFFHRDGTLWKRGADKGALH